METIIAGRFETKGAADLAASVLQQYTDKSDICIFHMNPPGQHDVSPRHGDENNDPGAEGADGDAARSAAAGGLIGGSVGAIGGPLGALAGAATGAYVGSMVGAITSLGDESMDASDVPRYGGIMLAVRMANPSVLNRVVRTLRAEGAVDVEQAEGEWRGGDWTSFDPLSSPRLVDA